MVIVEERDDLTLFVTINTVTHIISRDRLKITNNKEEGVNSIFTYTLHGLTGDLSLSKDDYLNLINRFNHFKNKVTMDQKDKITDIKNEDTLNSVIIDIDSLVAKLVDLPKNKENAVAITNLQQANLWLKESKRLNYKLDGGE